MDLLKYNIPRNQHNVTRNHQRSQKNQKNSVSSLEINLGKCVSRDGNHENLDDNGGNRHHDGIDIPLSKIIVWVTEQVRIVGENDLIGNQLKRLREHIT